MNNFDDIKLWQLLRGVVPDEKVTVISITPFGKDACEIVYRNRFGGFGSQVFFASDLKKIKSVQESSGYSFECDSEKFKIVSEAERIKLAYLFDPYMAVHSSVIEPLPHQITAVYEKMLPMHPLRFVLADDPGAGKTIMAGLLIKELMIRGDVKRCLIVSPGSITEQWQDELFSKFNTHFELLTNDMLEGAASGNAFEEHDLLIARLDKLSRNEEVQKRLEATEWDLVIIDEAHKLSASVIGNKVNYTRRYRLGQLLSKHTRHFLLLTATPHNGKEADFQQFMSLVDSDRFQCHSNAPRSETSYDDVMRRLVKEELLKFDGTPLFPERFAKTVSYDLSEEEKDLYEDVTKYVRDQFNLADKLKENRKAAVGFALTLLQRRLASSPEAIYQSLRRRKERLEKRMKEMELGVQKQDEFYSDNYDDIDEDLPEDELETLENDVIDEATAAATVQEMESEIAILNGLEAKADAIRRSNRDCKWDQLSELLQSPELRDGTGHREKLIIFTEHKDTLDYLTAKVRNLLGRRNAVINIHGGMQRSDRHNAENLFKQDKEVSILIATDAAGEGINLQRAHFMINYDLPWNPNRLEQRFGRIHRIGQTHICYLWNIIASNTREGQVFDRLFDKLEQERKALGGKVFDVLGKIQFDNKPLRDILIDAIRFGNLPEHRDYIHKVIDDAFDKRHLVDLLDSHALTKEIMDINTVNRVREDMERMEARRLQPFYIQDFFEKAFTLAGGLYHKRESGRFEVTRVPQSIQQVLPSTRWGTKVLRRYERITFEKEGITVEGKPDADLICPGHPLLDSLIAWVEAKYGSDYSNGSILIDPQDKTEMPRLLCCLDTTIRDAVQDHGNDRVVARQMSFLEISNDGKSHPAGFAPYIDYAPVPEGNLTKVRDILKNQKWLSCDVEKIAVSNAVTTIIPSLLEETRKNRLKTIDKIMKEVQDRLSSEINYWDGKVNIYKEKIRKGDSSQTTRNNMDQAQQKADMLDERRTVRRRELELEKNMVPSTPVVRSAALIIPASMLYNKTEDNVPCSDDRKAVEIAGMKAVMDIEKAMGFSPKDVSSLNLGYDIESVVPADRRNGGSILRCIEVKARVLGHEDNVTISRNEINTGFNIPEQFILALVTVDGDRTETTYCMKCFAQRPEMKYVSMNFQMNDLLRQSVVIYDERKI